MASGVRVSAAEAPILAAAAVDRSGIAGFRGAVGDRDQRVREGVRLVARLRTLPQDSDSFSTQESALNSHFSVDGA